MPTLDWKSGDISGGAREALAALRGGEFAQKLSVFKQVSITNPVNCTAHCLYMAAVLSSHTPYRTDTTCCQLSRAQDSLPLFD